MSFDRCLVELFACDCVCVCLQVRGQIECRLTGVSSSCLRVIVCVQVSGQIECRLTGVSSCLRVIVYVCVCRSEVRSSVV